jgi:beta-lactamase regulating signal transducer with metallopeptidase domain
MSALHTLLSQQMIERLGWMLIHFVWQAAVVALLLAATLRLLRRSSSSIRYAAACAALGLIVVLPLVTMQLVPVTRPVAEAGPPPVFARVASAPAQQVVKYAPAPPVNVKSLQTAGVAVPIPLKERFISVLAPALPYLVLGWLIGVFGLSAWHLGGWTQLQRLKRRMVRPTADVLQTSLTSLAARLGVRRAIGLLESMLIEVPTVVGWVRPVILLPAGALTGLSGAQLEAILAHELAHVRRYDYLVNILQTVIEILGFYHPALWWISHQIRVERENCCDDLAVRLCGDSIQYARALTHLEEMRHRRTDLAVAADGGSLLSRVARLLGRPAQEDRRFTWLPGLIALALITALIALAVCSVPARASRATLNDVTTSEGKPNDANTPKDLSEEPEIRLEFVVAEVFADRVPDSNTAAKMTSLLYRLRRSGLSSAGRSERLVTRERAPGQLTRPLGEIFATYDVNAPEALALLDLLVSRGYAEVVSRPDILVTDGKRATVATDDPHNSSDAMASPPADGLRLNLTVTPKVNRSETDAVTLEGPFEQGWFNSGVTIDDSGVHALAVLTNGAFTLLHPSNMTSRVDPQGRRRIPLLLVKSTIMGRQNTTAENVRAATMREGQAQADRGGKTQVLLTIRLAEIPNDRVLDSGTLASVVSLLGQDRGNIEAAKTAIEFLALHISDNRVNDLINLLQSRGYIETLVNPQVLVGNGETAQIRSGSDDPQRNMAPASTSVTAEETDYGMRLSVTPHVFDNNDVALELKIGVSDPIPADSNNASPGTHVNTMNTTITTQDRLPILLHLSKSRYLVIEPIIIRPQPAVWPQVGVSSTDVNDANEQVLAKFIIAKVRPEKKVDRRTATELARVLNRPVESIEGTPVREFLQKESETASAEQFAAAIRSLGTAGYVEVLSKPVVLGRLGQRASVEVGGGDPNKAPPGSVLWGMRFWVVPEEAKDKQSLQLTADIEIRLTKVLPPPPGAFPKPQSPLVSVQSLKTTTCLEVPSGKYAVQNLGGVTLAPPADPNAEAYYLMASATMPSRNQTASQPKPAGNLLDAIAAQETPAPFTMGPAMNQPPGRPQALAVPAPTPVVIETSDNDKPITMIYKPEETTSDRSGRPVDAQEMRRRLLKDVEPQSWEEAGGAGRIRVRDPQWLAINQTPFIHRRIQVYVARNLNYSVKTTGPAIRIESRLLSLSDEALTRLRTGPSANDGTPAADAEPLHVLARDLGSQQRLVLTETQYSALIRVAERDANSVALSAPALTTFEGCAAEIGLTGSERSYVAGYIAPSESGGEPKPDVQSVRTGLTWMMIPWLDKPDQVELDSTLVLTRIEGMETRTDATGLSYEVPKIDRLEFPMQNLSIPENQTVLVVGPKTRRVWQSEESSRDEPPRSLLILIRARPATPDKLVPASREIGQPS